MTKPASSAAAAVLGLFAALLAAPAMIAATPATAQSCTTIGSSTFCGSRGSHNTVGNTVIFNSGQPGRRIGNFIVTGTPPRTSVLGNSTNYSLVAPRTFAGVATPRRFNGLGSGTLYDSRLAALRAEILALEAQYQLQQMELTPAQRELGSDMPPALLRALTLANQARAAEESAAPAPTVQ
jgi:hypothetical protein